MSSNNNNQANRLDSQDQILTNNHTPPSEGELDSFSESNNRDSGKENQRHPKNVADNGKGTMKNAGISKLSGNSVRQQEPSKVVFQQPIQIIWSGPQKGKEDTGAYQFRNHQPHEQEAQ